MAESVNIQKGLMVFAILCYILMIMVAIVGLVKVDEANNDALVETCDAKNSDLPSNAQIDCLSNFNGIWAVCTVCIFIILFALIGILAELRVEMILRHFMFLARYIGRGLFLVFCAILCFGVAGDFGLSVGIIAIACGFLYLIVGIFMVKEHQGANTSA